jgi:hypothetical protein
VPQTQARLSELVVARHPLGSQGASGNTLERVTLRDGRDLICKRCRRNGDRFDERRCNWRSSGGWFNSDATSSSTWFRGGDGERASAIRELAWWTGKVGTAFETWSPI